MTVRVFPIPLTVLTGFLGAGKTTLLNRLLREPAMADCAVIVNEWGAVAIDHLLVASVSENVIELAGGCLCCTVRGDLVDTLADLARQVETGEIRALKRVVVETTGLADPTPVLQAMMEHPALLHAYRLDGVVTLVDALHGWETLDDHWEAEAQGAVADRLVLSKTDLAKPEAAVRLKARLAVLNPRAEIVSAQDRPGAALLSAGLIDPETRTADLGRWLGEKTAAHDHGAHDGHEGHGHGVRSFALAHPGRIPFSAVETFLDLLRSMQGDKLLRMKGVVELTEDPSRPLVLHGVRSSLHPPAWLPAWPEGPRGLRLVLIGRGLDEDYVRRLFSAVTGRPAVDMPDRAALEDNPLAIAGFGGLR